MRTAANQQLAVLQPHSRNTMRALQGNKHTSTPQPVAPAANACGCRHRSKATRTVPMGRFGRTPPPWGSALIGPSQTMGQTMAQTMGQTMAQMDHHNEAEHKLLHCHGCKTA